MLFNSIEFAFFLPIVFILYWFVFKSLKSQNILILFASYLFYGWWDWRFLSLIAFSTAIDFFVGNKLKVEKKENTRRTYLFMSLFVNLGLLGFFKYFNFFIANFNEAFTFFGAKPSISSLSIILPVGISFYTFQTLSYTIDVYKKELKPSSNIVDFAAYVSFFPQLVAGPIERASNLLPQIERARLFSYQNATNGLRLILWGLFKKIVIADNCAPIVDSVFSNYETLSSIEIVYGVVLFAFQIYGDFSGYSDIAIGVAALFGITLMTNFKTPYFSRDIAEFWRKWHISLSTWFRDYLYIPLGGSKGSRFKVIRNVFVIFIVSGFWHGANWTFIFWGALNALYFIPLLLMNRNRNNVNSINFSLKNILSIFFTFFLTCTAWVFFRSNTVTEAFEILYHSATNHFFPSSLSLFRKYMILALIIFIIFEWKGRNSAVHSWILSISNKTVRWLVYFFILFFIAVNGAFEETPFIYFQF